jgi:hypothetical protein
MSDQSKPRRPDGAAGPIEKTEHQGHGHGGHAWLMLLCCLPMIIAALFILVGR